MKKQTFNNDLLSRLVRTTPLSELVDVAVLQRVQDGFAETTGISVVIRDLQGRRVTKPSCQNKFCSLLSNSAHGSKCCQESNRRAVTKASQEHRVVKYVCHAGLTQYAAPIEISGICVGTIVMGDRPEGSLDGERVADIARKTGIPKKKLADALNTLKRWSEEEMSRSITLLLSIANSVAGLCYQGAELRARLREMSMLYEISRQLAGTLDLNKLLRQVARSATQIFNAKGCSIRLLDAKGKRLVIKSFYNLSQRYLDKGPVHVEKSSIDRAALNGEIVQINDMLSDPRVLYPKEAEQEGIRSGISLGLISKQRPIGTLHLYCPEPRLFDEDEIQLLRSLAYQAAVAIDNAQLYQQSLEKRKLDRELRLAGAIQEQLLPERPPDLNGFDMAAESQPCSDVGGDFYDFIQVKGGRTALVIADVAGKGMPGALLMASARAGLRAHLESTQEPRELMRRLNRNLYRDTRSGQFVTLFCGMLDTKKRLLTYTNAGHNPPIIVRNKKIILLEAGGLVLGADDKELYDQAQVTLQSGDLLLMYTDGVTEAMNTSEEIFSMKRLRELLLTLDGVSPEEVIKRIQVAVRIFTRNMAQSDDITLVAICVE